MAYKPQIQKILYLNTEVNCSKVVSGDTTKNIEFSWNLPYLKIDDLAHLKVVNFAHQGTESTNNIITLRIKDIQYNSRNYYSSDNNFAPIIFNGDFISNPYWSPELGITLLPQMINNITLIASDDITNTYGGIDTAVKFIIGITIDEFDVKYSQIGNPYGEERTNNLNNKLY